MDQKLLGGFDESCFNRAISLNSLVPLLERLGLGILKKMFSENFGLNDIKELYKRYYAKLWQ